MSKKSTANERIKHAGNLADNISLLINASGPHAYIEVAMALAAVSKSGIEVARLSIGDEPNPLIDTIESTVDELITKLVHINKAYDEDTQKKKPDNWKELN